MSRKTEDSENILTDIKSKILSIKSLRAIDKKDKEDLDEFVINREMLGIFKKSKII